MRFVTSLLVCVLSQSALYAGSITISGSGTWDSTLVPSSSPPDGVSVSEPGASWSFSFVVSSPLDSSLVASTTDASYLLNGAPVSDTFSFVEFYTTSDGGMFDILFDSDNGIELYGPQIFDANNNLIPGSYSIHLDDVFASTYAGPPLGEGSGTVIVGAASVPEPSSIISSGIALAVLTGLSLARRKRSRFTSMIKVIT